MLRWLPVLWWILWRTVGDMPSRPLGTHYAWPVAAGAVGLVLAVEGWFTIRRQLGHLVLRRA